MFQVFYTRRFLVSGDVVHRVRRVSFLIPCYLPIQERHSMILSYNTHKHVYINKSRVPLRPSSSGRASSIIFLCARVLVTLSSVFLWRAPVDLVVDLGQKFCYFFTELSGDQFFHSWVCRKQAAEVKTPTKSTRGRKKK